MAHILDVLKKKTKEESPVEASSPAEEEVPVEAKPALVYIPRVGVRITPKQISVLDNLDDVEIATPADGEALVYDEASEKWKNKTVVGMVEHGNEWHDPDMVDIETYTVHVADPDAHHDKLHAIDSALDHSGVITNTQHGDKTTIPNAHHNRQHALSSASDHTGEITDAQHGVRTLANAHAHSALSGIGANDHHNKVHALAHVDHPDVSIVSPADGEILTYEVGVASKWKNKAPSIVCYGGVGGFSPEASIVFTQTSRYIGFKSVAINTTESYSQDAMFAGTLKKIKVYVPYNTLNGNFTLTLRKNSQSVTDWNVTFSAGETGTKEMAGADLAIANGDLLCFLAEEAATSGSVNFGVTWKFVPSS